MLELLNLHDHHVFLRRDALRHGYDDDDISRELQAGRIARVRWGAYTAADVWQRSDPLARHVLCAHAVLMTHGAGVVLSHTSAAAMHGLACWGADLDRVHLSRLDGSSSRVCRDVTYHRGALPEGHIETISSGGLVTSPARAAVETATVSTVEGGLVTVDSYLHRYDRTGLDEIEEVYASRLRWPGNRRLNITLRLARPGAQSVGESRMRYLMWEHHLPEPELQYVVTATTGKVIGISDFGWAAHKVLGEFDGKVKYSTYLREGETPADAVVREKRREDLMRETTGFAMIRFVWADLHARARTAARIRSALGLR